MEPARPVRRPLPWLAGALALATVAGGALGAPDPRAGPALLAAAALLAGLAARRVPPAWLPLVALAALAGWRSAPDGPPAPASPGALTAARAEPLIGRWRAVGPRHGLLEPARGASPALGHRLLLECVGPAPAEGAWTLVLPGSEVVPWPRGPVPGPARREGGPLGTSRVLPDELVTAPAPPGRGDALRGLLADRADRLEARGAGRGLLRALLLGDRSGVPAETLDLFTRTGTRHLLALSGMHVGLLALLLLAPSTALVARLLVGSNREHLRPGTRRALRTALQLGLLALFVLLVGAGDPVARAGTALALVWIAPLLRPPGTARWEGGRPVDGLSVWGAALLLETLVDPRGLASPSLRLSYLATLGILLATRPLVERLRGTRDPERALWASLRGATPGHWLGVGGLRLWRLGRGAVAASVVAVLATLPESAPRFGELAPVGVLATPLVLPLVAGILVSGWWSVLAPAAVGARSTGDSVAGALAELLVTILEGVDRLPGTPWVLPERPTWLWTLAVVLVLAHWTRPAGCLGRAAACASGLLLLPWCPAPNGLELVLLDVGHGSAAVLRGPGLDGLVFDAGSRDRPRLYEEALAPLLRRWEVDRPWIGLSHDHGDHRSALPRLVERHPPRLWLGALPQDLAERTAHTPRLDPREGRLEFDPVGPLRLALIRGLPGRGNEGSRSLEVRLGGHGALLSGDAEAEGLGAALERGWLLGPLEVLLFPHHGSESEHTGELLRRLRPRRTWVAAARLPPVGRELDRRGLDWSWTGEAGPLASFLPGPGGARSPSGSE